MFYVHYNLRQDYKKGKPFTGRPLLDTLSFSPWAAMSTRQHDNLLHQVSTVQLLTFSLILGTRGDPHHSSMVPIIAILSTD